MQPALTLAICCYNFERFVTEAVEGAFAQTYRPLEIVISDDHSPDATWEKIVAAVIRLGGLAPSETEVWRKSDFCGTVELMVPGDLHLVLNRNEKNLGLAFHENRLFELSHGEWIAFQAGDDVSLPNRMEVIAKCVREDPTIRCLHCPTQVIDVEGKAYAVPDSFLRQNRRSDGNKVLPYVLGAGAVYHQDVYRLFGALGTTIRNEDQVLPLRAKLLGPIKFIESQLVQYRKHGDNASGAYQVGTPQETARFRMRLQMARYQGLIDLQTAEMAQLVDVRTLGHYRRLIKKDIDFQRFMIQWELHNTSRPLLFLSLAMSPSLLINFGHKLFRRLLSNFKP